MVGFPSVFLSLGEVSTAEVPWPGTIVSSSVPVLSLSCHARDIFQDSHSVISRLFRHNYSLGRGQHSVITGSSGGTGLDRAVRGYGSTGSGNGFVVYSSNLTDIEENDMTREYLQCRFYIQFKLG